MREARFSLGRVVATPGALQAMKEHGINGLQLLARHVRGDWGDICPEDKKENEFSLQRRLRLLSSYTIDGTKLWIITEADRSATTFLLPSEY